MLAEITETVLSDEERRLAQAIAARSKSDALADAVIAEVAAIFDVSVVAIKGTSRLRRLVDARSVIARALLARGYTTVDIGEILCRDHSTVINLDQRLQKDHDLRSIVAEVAA